MRVYVCRKDLQAAQTAAQRLVQIGHRIIACTSSQNISLSSMCRSGADVFLLDRYMPHPDGVYLKKALPMHKCILINTDLDTALNELEAWSCCSVNTEIRKRIYDELLLLGFRSNTLGTRQLVEALCMVMQDERVLYDLKHCVYDKIAQTEHCAWQSIERNLRYAIENVWTRGDLDVLQQRFGETIDAERGKPTNKAFLAQIAEHIRMDSLHRTP